MLLEQQLLNFALLGAGWVLWLLVALSVVCIAVAVERAIFVSANTSPAAALQQAMQAFFKDGDPARLHRALKDMKGIEAHVLAAGADAALAGSADAAEDAMAGAVAFQRLRLDRGLLILGTTGSNAPFLGLFGTVLGIIKAFHELAQDTAEAATSVMAGISEALVATAVGLLVAIPAVVLYNVLTRRNKSLLARTESLSLLLLSRLHARNAEAPAATNESHPAGRTADAAAGA